MGKRSLLLNGWRVSFDKVRLTKTLQSEFGYTLTLAKSVTDRVLAGEIVALALENSYPREEELLRTLQDIGVDASLNSGGPEVVDLPPELALGSYSERKGVRLACRHFPNRRCDGSRFGIRLSRGPVPVLAVQRRDLRDVLA